MEWLEYARLRIQQDYNVSVRPDAKLKDRFHG